MPPPSTAPLGVVESAFHRLVSRRARVRDVEPVGDAFRLVTLVGEDLEDRRWTPGDMIQIGFAGLAGRAYTPLSFDLRAGTTRFLGYVHGHGIASSWLASATIGEQLFLVGPRSALDLGAVNRPMIFFGDETSFGTAAAIRATPEGMRGVAFSFEVESEGASRIALERIGVTNGVTLTTREPQDRHLDRIESDLTSALGAAPQTRCVFTGRASSIQRLYKAVRRAGVPAKQVTNVAYWAPGRKGFSGVQR
ncbi:siderophore-interacting protein [Sorangium sp. So ce590]|uniref:siderophore-interacting protein n=1 Tax=unclassified Sorangium TaxID=2621164 RepID=UPI003F61700C